MKFGMVGLGRMGGDLVRRASEGGHQPVFFDTDTDKVEALVDEGICDGAESLQDLCYQLDTNPRVVWIMVPAAIVESVLDDLVPLLSSGDIIIDGGNSHYHDAISRANELADREISYVDVGTSGGVWGLENGYCLMVGGEADAVDHLDPLLAALAPGVDAAARTPGRDGDPEQAEHGYLHCGPSGAGHLVKMVHNGIEYATMAAYAEGLNILANADRGATAAEADAETAPLRHPEHYRFDIDLDRVAEVWRRGSVIQSWLLDLTAAALVEDPVLEGFDGRVSDSGEGRWTSHAAIDVGVPAPVLTTALYERFASRGNDDHASRLLSAMRKQFGGHDEKSE